MAGYANRTIRIDFPELAEDGDSVWVVIKNPQLQTPEVLRPKDVPTDENGRPLDTEGAVDSMYEVIAGLVLAWHVYDATELNIDPVSGAELPQELLPTPASPELVKKLPMGIITSIGTRIKDSVNPQ